MNTKVTLDSGIKGMIINKHMKLSADGCLSVDKGYAEDNLSKSALKLGEKTSRHYNFIWNRTSAVVWYELPKLFPQISFLLIMRYLINYCMPYVVENNINDSNIHTIYLKMMDKKLK